MKFVTHATVLEHNCGYEKCNLLTKMFGINEHKEKGLAMREKRRITPETIKKKRKT